MGAESTFHLLATALRRTHPLKRALHRWIFGNVPIEIDLRAEPEDAAKDQERLPVHHKLGDSAVLR